MTGRHTNASAEASAQPIFVDRSGRRRRMVAVVGTSLAVVIVVALAALFAGLSGVAPLRVPGFPDLARPTNGPSANPDNPVIQAGLQGRLATTPAATPSPSPSRTSPRRIPTQTPSHSPKPTR